MKFTHLIISRINIRWKEQAQNEAWLSNRINILNSTLRPSLEAQTNQNFKFITLWGYEPIGGISNEHQINFENKKLVEIHQGLVNLLPNYVDEDHVLITRVDSDNCLGDRFVETLHNNIGENVPFYYDIGKMDMINTITKKKTTWIASKTSGFISVMEKTKDFTCIPYGYSHGLIGNHFTGMILDLDVLLTIHGDNLSVKQNLGSSSDFDVSKYNLKL